MKTPITIVALSIATAFAAVNAHAQRADYFQEVGVTAQPEPDLQHAPSGYCGAPACGDSCGSCGGCGSCSSCCCCCENPFCLRSGVFGEALILTPRDQEIAMTVPGQFVVGPGGVPPLLQPQGRTNMLDLDYQPGYRVGGVAAVDCNLAFGLTYTAFESNTNNGRVLNAGEIANNVNLFPLLMHPTTLVPGPLTNTAASGSLGMDFDIVDLDARMLLFNTNNFGLCTTGGARWVHFENDVRALYAVNGGTVVLGNAEYDGVGGRGGMDAEYRHSSGFGGYGKGALSLIYGAGRGSYEQFQVFNQVNPQILTDGKADRLSPLLDLEVGVHWLSPQQHVRLSMGYMTMAWFNVITVRDYINGVQHQVFDDLTDSITFDGLTARAEVRW